ncbi:Enamine deaminase RidA, house cleaning of reactive enamine intermediates, YjgF/YER057c/UK114 family [Litoreibacter ascidiaceicola]|uniref:Enamine deaminase RidA, house cleaning of reactive enamine intermediates, YjgF/YER057c/UK114 family n=1 Tax=Litoreibacter ascidiaceicola TaxID=1486859 RepID=A0A1M4SY48_9RHOB|nr:RidA family protein [Litoreibacter ascidiaceicola]SHE37094.1 Enamine deaminase RidA, house cleaning of reactive enamine intermediates, YjgF/YER057c/UK114 family [Litoreibacter ascidiaceicola]
MTIRRISSGGAFEPKVGYCRAVVAGDWVHVAGTVAAPLPETGEPPEGAAAQCKSALAIIERALNEAGAGFSDVVRVTYMLPAADEFEACWPVLSATFGDNPPAATMIECGLIDPKYRIEIEVTAYKPAR